MPPKRTGAESKAVEKWHGGHVLPVWVEIESTGRWAIDLIKHLRKVLAIGIKATKTGESQVADPCVRCRR